MKKNLPLIVGIAVPAVFVIILALVIYIPSLYVNPQYNFLYSSENNYYSYPYNLGYKNYYKVGKDGKIALEPTPYPGYGIVKNLPVPADLEKYSYKGDAPPLYLYNIINGSSKEISLEDAQKYSLDPGPTSPDGYNINYDYNYGGIFDLMGGGGNNSGYYISKGTGKKKLNIFNSTQNGGYYMNFNFIGWIKQ